MSGSKVIYTIVPEVCTVPIARYLFDEETHYDFEWKGMQQVNQRLPELAKHFQADFKRDPFPDFNTRISSQPSQEAMNDLFEGEYDTIMCHAAERNCPSVIKYLADCGFDINELSHNGERPLHRAVQDNYLHCTNVLLQLGANINGLTDTGNTPLHYAYMWNRDDVVELLLNQGADPNILNKMGQKPADATTMSTVAGACV